MPTPQPNIDLAKRNRLIAKYVPELLGDSEEAAEEEPPVLTVGVEEFFDGNDDPGTIGNGVFSRMEDVREPLLSLRSRPQVVDVRVSINEWPNPGHRGDDDMWPLAENVFIWTTATVEQVREWVKPLNPDGVGEWEAGQVSRGLDVVAIDRAHRVVCLTWD